MLQNSIEPQRPNRSNWSMLPVLFRDFSVFHPYDSADISSIHCFFFNLYIPDNDYSREEPAYWLFAMTCVYTHSIPKSQPVVVPFSP